MNNWKYEKLSKLCSRIGDGLHGTPEYSEESDIYFINGNNLKNGKIEINNNSKRVSQKELNDNFIPLDKYSLLMSINGTLGNMAFYNNERVMLGKSSAYINFKTSINRFYYYYFQLSGVQEHFHNVATGSTIKNLSLKSIQDFEVPVPNEDEWKKIAKVLSDLDAKIEINNKINTELEAMAKTLYDYWFVQFDFPDTNGKPYKTSGGKMVYNEELKREIPEGWEVVLLDDIVDLITGNVSAKNIDRKTPYLGLEHIPRRTIVLSNWDTAEKIDSDKTVFKKHDILFGKIRPYFHKVGIALIDGITSTDTIILRPKINSHKGLALQIVFTDEFVEIATNSSTGSKMPRANWNILKNYKIPIPPEELINNYNLHFENIIKKIEIAVNENQQLASLRDWLLPMLMNGQVRVGDVEEALSMVAEEKEEYKISK